MKGISDIRRRYLVRLIARAVIFVACVVMCYASEEEFEILEGMNFFDRFYSFHLLWVIWIFDIILQIIPLKNKVALGSQKLFAMRFKPIRDKVNYASLKKYVLTTTKSAYKVFLLWSVLICVLGGLYFWGIIGKIGLFLTCVFFYLCDLICVLFFCPFRLIMKNKCCTTCRIFNWDHLMMFSPLVFVGGFFSLSLVIMSLIAWLVWEGGILIYPERFCEMTNAALRCSECTDKLCTQYCQKIRKK